MKEIGDSRARQNALRVLQVTPYYAPAWGYGGVVEAVFQLTRYLARAGADVRVLTTDANGEHQRLTQRLARRTRAVLLSRLFTVPGARQTLALHRCWRGCPH